MRGNPCLVLPLDRPPATPPAPAAITQCLTWTDAHGKAKVRCWTPSGAEIQLCGHGLLCCAHYWHEQWGEQLVLSMNGLEIDCEQRDDTGWLSLPTLATRACPVPGWATALLGSTPRQAAEAGPADGYLVLEMPRRL